MHIVLFISECEMQGITVTCLVACLDDVEGDSLASAVRQDMDLSCKIPAGVGSSHPQLVVGTLDINQGELLSLLCPTSTFLCHMMSWAVSCILRGVTVHCL